MKFGLCFLVENQCLICKVKMYLLYKIFLLLCYTNLFHSYDQFTGVFGKKVHLQGKWMWMQITYKNMTDFAREFTESLCKHALIVIWACTATYKHGKLSVFHYVSVFRIWLIFYGGRMSIWGWNERSLMDAFGRRRRLWEQARDCWKARESLKG